MRSERRGRSRKRGQKKGRDMVRKGVKGEAMDVEEEGGV